MLALLIRHAQVAHQDRIGLRADLPLSETGRKEAHALAGRLGRHELAAVFTSPLARTIETAEIVAAGRNVPLIPEPSLIEVNPGNWENRRFADLAGDAAWGNYNTFRSGTRIPGGEMMIEVQSRVVAFLENISSGHRGRSVAVVSHADVIRAAICHYAGIPLDLSLRIEISPASTSMLEIEDWGARLIRLNDTGSF